MTTARRDFVKISIPLEPNSDEDMICILCGQKKCEYALTMRGNGRRVWVGIHEECATPYGVPGSHAP